jgi:TfuA protein
MNSEPIVYLGPSLPKPEAARLLAADFRPPVRRGDLLKCPPERVVVIIDGEFGQSLSVSPKEILGLLDRGTCVIGASSMGALRAAELESCGMVGCGWVFESYRSGRIVRDDEVALTFSPFDLQPLTVPLVNVRCWVERLQEAELIDALTARRMLRCVERIFYADRTPERVHQVLEASVGSQRLPTLLSATGGRITDIKAFDTRLALNRAAACHAALHN